MVGARALAQNKVADERVPARSIAPRDDGRIAYRRALSQSVLDGLELDAEPSYLDLPVAAPKELDTAVGTPPREVAGAVHHRAGSGIERIGPEFFGGGERVSQVATRDAVAAGEQLARDPRRHGLATWVEQVHACIRDRLADRHGVVQPFTRLHSVAASEGRVLRRPVAVDDDTVPLRVEQALHMRDRQHVASGQHLAHIGEGL